MSSEPANGTGCPALAVEDLSYTYKNGHKALDRISFEVRAGEVFGLLGANGAGKTTVMRLVSGVLRLQCGSVSSYGVGLRDYPVGYRMRIAYVPDEPVFYENMSVGRHLDFICDVFSVESKDRKERIADLSRRLGFQALMGRRISSLSRGMRHKLSIMSSLVHDPGLLILDEPLTSLDPLSSCEVKKLILSFAGSGGAVFLSTHMLDAADQLCSRIGIVSAGRLVDVASAVDLKGRGSLEEHFLSVAYDGV